uniref:BTB domain-containing protein n=1 Tax=Caenorhabditis japonica TaxID=281687 RepID=A0A8R1IFE4_CAEJA
MCGIRTWNITIGFRNTGNSEYNLFYKVAVAPDIVFRVYGDLRVTIFNNLSKRKSVIRTRHINELAKNRPFEDVTDLQHSTIDKEGSGFLDEERLFKMRFEIRVHYVLDQYSKLTFNYFDKMFTDCFTFLFELENYVLYVKPKLLHFHSPVLAALLDSGVKELHLDKGSHHYMLFLGILHGTSFNITSAVYAIAQLYEVETVCRKFEMLTMKKNNYGPLEFSPTYNQFNFGTALRVMLSRVENVESLKKCVQSMDVERISGEVMKKLAEKMFSFPLNN